MASVQADKGASLSTKASTFIKPSKQDPSSTSSLLQPEQTQTTAKPLKNPKNSPPTASPAPAPHPGDSLEQPAVPAVSAPPLSSLGPQHVRFETPPTGYSYSNPQAHTTSDPSHQASGPLPPFRNYPESFNFSYGPPNLPPISNVPQPGPYHPYISPHYYDEWQGGAVPSAILGGRLVQNHNPSYYGRFGSTQPIHAAPNPFAPSSVMGGSYSPYEDRSVMPHDAVGLVDFSNPARRNSFPGAPNGLSRRFDRDSDSDFEFIAIRPDNPVSSDSESSEVKIKSYRTTRNKSSVLQDPTKESPLPYVQKINKAAAYRSKVEGRHLNPFASHQAQAFPVPTPSSLSSISAQTADTLRSTATGSSKASRTSKNSDASKVRSAISSNTSVESEDEKDNRKSNGPTTSIDDEEKDVQKSNGPTITRVVIKSGSGNVKVKFAGSEADLGGGAECSFTTVENATSFDGSVLDDDSEDPLISLEHPTGTAKEASLLDAIDRDEGSEIEKKRRKMIRRGKQPERFTIEDITAQEDNSDSQQQTPATLLDFSDASDQFSIQSQGPSEWTQDSLGEIEGREDTDKRHFRRKTVTFDPYSSEDLDLFNDCIAEGPGHFDRSLQLFSSITSSPARFPQGRFCDERLSSSTSSRLQILQPLGMTEAPSRGPLNQQVQVYECIIQGCPETFHEADLLAEHTYKHGMSWNFSSPRRGNTSKAPVSTISSPSLDEETPVDLVVDNRSEHALSSLWTGGEFSVGVDNASAAMSVRRRPSTFPVRSVPRGSDSENQDLVESRLNSSNEGGLASLGAIGTLQPRQRTQNQTFESTQEPLETSPCSARPSYWRILGLKNTFKRFFRPRIAPDSHRIEWTCGCGEPLYADFNNKDQDTMSWIAGTLQVPSGRLPAVQSPPYLQIPPRTLGSLDHMRRASSSTASFSGTGSRTSAAWDSTSSTDASTFSSSSSNSSTPNFLELCVNIGEHLKELGEIDLTYAKCDGDLFGAVQERYLQIRGYRSKFWLLKPAAVSFVRFSVEQRNRVGIFQKPLALPPEEEVYSNRWIYDPCPWDGDPPIAEHLFLHYLKCTQRSRNLFWMLRIPRKLKTSILNDGIASAAFGWGVHIDEGPNYSLIFWINFFGLMVSGTFAAAWTVWKKDFQGAFGFACWFIAVMNTLMIALMYRWKLV